MTTAKMSKWPFLTAIVVLFLNVDFVVIPFLRSFHIPLFRLFVFASILATAELRYYFWFWHRLASYILHSQTGQDAEKLGLEIGGKLKEMGYVEKIKWQFKSQLHWALNGNHRVSRWIRNGGCAMLFVIGALPEPGARTTAVIFCGVPKWEMGFFALALGNIIKTAYVVGGWDFIFRLFKH